MPFPDDDATFENVTVTGRLIVGAGYIDSALGFVLPVEYLYGVATAAVPDAADRILRGVSFVSDNDGLVVGQLTATEYSFVNDGEFASDPEDYRRLWLYGVEDILLDAADGAGQVLVALPLGSLDDTAHVFAIPHTDVDNIAAGAGTTTSLTYQNLPARCRVATFAKQLDATKLVVTIAGHATQSGGLNTIDIGVRVNGADYNVAVILGSGTPTGSLEIPGIPAGTHNVEVRWKVSAGTATQLGRWSIAVTESF